MNSATAFETRTKIEANSPAVLGEDSETFCVECHTRSHWGSNRWCPACGFSPEDSIWRSELSTQEQQSVLLPEPLIPFWFRVLALGTLSVVIVTVTIRILTFVNDVDHLRWTQLQIAIGLLVAIGAHLTTGFVAVRKSPPTVARDVIIRPLKIWQSTFHRIKRNYLAFCLLCWGILAVALAIFSELISF